MEGSAIPEMLEKGWIGQLRAMYDSDSEGVCDVRPFKSIDLSKLRRFWTLRRFRRIRLGSIPHRI
jgi:hypothetical protein